MLEITTQEHLKILLKHVLAFLFHRLGGFKFFRWISKPAISIVTYHSLVEDDFKGVQPYIAVSLENFRKHLLFFQRNYCVISLDEAIERLSSNQVDKQYLVITFDDGYLDNLTLGLPSLSEFNMHATVFVTTGCVDGNSALWTEQLRMMVYSAKDGATLRFSNKEFRMSNCLRSRIKLTKNLITYGKTLDVGSRDIWLSDLSTSLECKSSGPRLMLNPQEVKVLADSNVCIGSHTVSHPILSCIELDTAWQEVMNSRQYLQAITEKSVDLFAYPNGTVNDFDERHIELLKKAGYSGAVTTIRGVNRPGIDLFRLRRTGVYSIDGAQELQLKLAIEGVLN